MSKYIAYFKYLLRHKYYVFMAMAQRGHFWRGLAHDLSKFRPSELLPYVEYFYGKNGHADSEKDGHHSTGLDTTFDRAWLLHQHRNPHHWQFWLLKEDGGTLKAIEIPHKYLIEMHCDWIGTSTAIRGKDDTPNWYAKYKDKMIIHPASREILEALIYNCKEQ